MCASRKTLQSYSDTVWLSQGYYIVYDTVGNFSRVFIRKDDDKRAKFLALMHRSNNSKGNENVVLGVGMPAEDLTLEEFRAILTNKPSYSEVTKAFRLLENTNVTINTQNITPIWG